MSIGEALAAAREDAGLTVSEVSAATRIRASIVRAIENGDFGGCGGDFYVRGHIRAIARVVGIDARPLIEEYDAVRRAEQLAIAADQPHPMPVRRSRPVMRAERSGINWTAVLGVAVVAALALAAYLFFTGSGGPRIAADRAPGKAVTPNREPSPQPGSPRSGSPQPSSTRSGSTPKVVSLQPLEPVSAIAFGPEGAGTGDDPGAAGAAIDGDSSTAWHTDWYTTAEFGNLKAGTGLLLDLGQQETVASVRLSLGQPAGASLQIRAGNSPVLADLRPLAEATGAGGVVRLPIAAQVQARYVLVWFTKLPPDQAGTYMANLYYVKLNGLAR
ncbi:MAG TPA: helix-turn-helix domain-containing protein [Streptosporangiaceae bacterium]|nr:helix-turn-helix domain-containing protein [Streptosporangiaceae bacterium]